MGASTQEETFTYAADSVGDGQEPAKQCGPLMSAMRSAERPSELQANGLTALLDAMIPTTLIGYAFIMRIVGVEHDASIRSVCSQESYKP